MIQYVTNRWRSERRLAYRYKVEHRLPVWERMRSRPNRFIWPYIPRMMYHAPILVTRSRPKQLPSDPLHLWVFFYKKTRMARTLELGRRKASWNIFFIGKWGTNTSDHNSEGPETLQRSVMMWCNSLYCWPRGLGKLAVPGTSVNKAAREVYVPDEGRWISICIPKRSLSYIVVSTPVCIHTQLLRKVGLISIIMTSRLDEITDSYQDQRKICQDPRSFDSCT